MEIGLRNRNCKEEDFEPFTKESIDIHNIYVPKKKSWKLKIQDKLDCILIYIMHKNWIHSDTTLTSKPSLLTRYAKYSLDIFLFIVVIVCTIGLAYQIAIKIEKTLDVPSIVRIYPSINSYTYMDGKGGCKQKDCFEIKKFKEKKDMIEYEKKSICTPIMPQDHFDTGFLIYVGYKLQLYSLYTLQSQILAIEKDNINVITSNMYWNKTQVTYYPCICTIMENGKEMHWVNPKLISIQHDKDRHVTLEYPQIEINNRIQTNIEKSIIVEYRDSDFNFHENVILEKDQVILFLDCLDLLYAQGHLLN